MASPAAGVSLQDRVALVAGSGSGIGRAIAIAYGGAGASVVCTDVNEAGVKETAAAVEKAGGRALARRSDVTQSADSRADVAAAVAAFGGIDVLTYCAARNGKKTVQLQLLRGTTPTPASWTSTSPSGTRP